MKKIITALLMLTAISTKADISLPSVISSNMVLQQQSTVKLWGWGNAAEKVYVTTSWDNKTDSTVVTGNADWSLNIKTPKAGGPYTITLKGNNTIILNNVLIGEVWLCSGQSNMEFNSYYKGAKDIKEELASANHPNIRFFQVPHRTSANPQDDCKAQWTICDSNSLKSFSAVGYFFGKKLNADLNVPIGLINASWGGTPAEVWTPAAVINSDDTLKKAAAQENPSKWWPVTPGYTYNGMLAPLTNFTIKGALWYQGETNAAAPTTYGKLLTSMITSWRTIWNRDFPFYLVQIAPYKYGNKDVAALVREGETKASQLPNAGMVVISDLVQDVNNIHPPDKHDVGTRLANLALTDTYHKTGIDAKSPAFKSMQIKNDKIIITLNHAENGLRIKGKKAAELFIAGEDKAFHPAEAGIKGNTLIVSSNEVKQPLAVRYQFSNAGIGNIFSKEGLPLAPFRTDSWQIDTSAIQ